MSRLDLNQFLNKIPTVLHYGISDDPIVRPVELGFAEIIKDPFGSKQGPKKINSRQLNIQDFEAQKYRFYSGSKPYVTKPDALKPSEKLLMQGIHDSSYGAHLGSQYYLV